MKMEMMKKMKEMMKDEGFASDAQRKAAFASGYKEKGKDKKEMAMNAKHKPGHDEMAMNAMKMNAMKMPIRAMYMKSKKEMKTGDDDMKPMTSMKMNAVTDPKKMNAMTMQDPKQDMLKKHSNDDIKAMKKMEMDMAKNNDDTETPSMETMKAMMMPKKEMMKKDEMAKNMEMMKRVNSMKKANPMYAMKDAGKEMMAAMKKVKQGENKKINAMYGEKYLPTREGSLEAAVLKSVSTKKTD